MSVAEAVNKLELAYKVLRQYPSSIARNAALYGITDLMHAAAEELSVINRVKEEIQALRESPEISEQTVSICDRILSIIK